MAEAAGESLVLTGAKEGPTGHRPGISIDSVDNVAVMVYDTLVDRKLYCCVGIVDKATNATAWGAPSSYGGKQPSVALIHVNDELYAFVVYRSQVVKSCFYRIGRVNKAQQSIEWVGEAVLLEQCYVVKPKICAACNGTVVIVHEGGFTFDDLRYHIGRFNEQNETITGLSTCSRIPRFDGVEPAVSISNDVVVFVCRSMVFDTLRTRLGTVNADNAIQWGEPSTLLNHSGKTPASALMLTTMLWNHIKLQLSGKCAESMAV